MRKDAPLAVDVPSPDRDNPGWVKVGVIAAIGFVVGIAWPRLVGVKLGPSAPTNESAAAARAEAPSASVAKGTAGPSAALATSGPGAAASGASSASSGASASASAAAAPAGPPQVNVLKGNVISCKTDEGDAKKGKECGSIAALDQVVAPRLRKVAGCSAAEGQTGKLSFIANADFASGRFSWDVGKSSTIGNLDAITSCLKTHFQGVTVGSVPHEHPRYTVAYTATFTAPLDTSKDKTEAAGEKADKGDKAAKGDKSDKSDAKNEATEPESKPEPPATPGGEATVAWEVALVRDTPKTGQVVARLPRGSKVKLGAVKDGWYAIKYGDGLANDGWVYRGAVGR